MSVNLLKINTSLNIISEHGRRVNQGDGDQAVVVVSDMRASANLRDEQVVTFDDTYLIEMTHRIARLRELHAAMEDTGKPRRWVDTLSLNTLR